MSSGRGLWMALSAILVVIAFAAGLWLAPWLNAGGMAPRISAGDETRGELTSRSPVNLKDGSRFKQVSVDLPETGVVLFVLDAPFEGHLSLLDSEGMLVSESGGNDRYGYSTEQREVQLGYAPAAAGRYSLIISGATSRGYGPFTVRSQVIEAGSGGNLVEAGEHTGWLNGPPSRYQIEVTEPARYRIGMQSDTFDAYLALSGNGISVSDDDGGEGSNALLNVVLMPGSYELEARRYSGSGATGLYTLTMSSEPMPDLADMATGGALEPGTPIQGWLQQDGGGHDYTLEVTEAGIYTFDLESDDFDAYLELSGNGVNASDDDGGTGRNSRLQSFLSPGSYQLRARTFSYGSGFYTLQARFTAATVADGDTPLVPDEPLTGNLRGGSVQHMLEITDHDIYVIDLSSSDFDTYLELVGPNTNEENDDGGSGTDSRIETELRPGVYQVTVRGFSSGARGMYVLEARRASPVF